MHYDEIFFSNVSHPLSLPSMVTVNPDDTAAAQRRASNNKALIKKVVGLIVVVAVCVAVIVIVLNVLKTFGDSSDDSKGETNYDGKYKIFYMLKLFSPYSANPFKVTKAKVKNITHKRRSVDKKEQNKIGTLPVGLIKR